MKKNDIPKRCIAGFALWIQLFSNLNVYSICYSGLAVVPSFTQCSPGALHFDESIQSQESGLRRQELHVEASSKTAGWPHL